MRDIPREIAEDYQEFFDFLNQEHNLILTISEMDELVFEAQKLVKKLSLGVVVGRSEQLVCSCDNPSGFEEMEQGRETCSKCNKPY